MGVALGLPLGILEMTNTPYAMALETLPEEAFGTVSGVIDSLRLETDVHPATRTAMILKRPLSAPLAALVCQGASLRNDKEAIEALKASNQSLPIIYVSKSAKPRRETAIRRMGIHYFLSPPVEAEELRLVLEVLVRNTSTSGRFERFFTR